jgi:hypothetical protein
VAVGSLDATLQRQLAMCADPSTCPLMRHLSSPDDEADFLFQMRVRLSDAGGLTTAEELKSLGLPTFQLATWMTGGQLRAITSGAEQWIPVFQLTEERRGLRSDVAAVAAELDGAFDDRDILSWFAWPNSSLGDATPLEHLPDNLHAVLQAARLDRFLASA